jgi:hypothetical protein
LQTVPPRNKAAARTIQRAYRQYKERSSALFLVPLNNVYHRLDENKVGEIHIRELVSASELSKNFDITEVADLEEGQTYSKIENEALNIEVGWKSEDEKSHFSIFSISEIDNESCTSAQKQCKKISENSGEFSKLENGRLNGFEQEDDAIYSLSLDENNSLVEKEFDGFVVQSSRSDGSEAYILSLSTSSAELKLTSAKTKDSSASFDTQISRSTESNIEYSDGEYSSYTSSYYSDEHGGSESELEHSPQPTKSKMPSTSPEEQAVIDYARLNKDRIKELKDASINLDAAVKKAKATLQASGEYPAPGEVISIENSFKDMIAADRVFLNSLALHETSAPAFMVNSLKVFYDKTKILRGQLEELFKRTYEVGVDIRFSKEEENHALHVNDSLIVNQHGSLDEAANVQESERIYLAEMGEDIQYAPNLYGSIDSAEAVLQQDDIDSTNKSLTSAIEDSKADFNKVQYAEALDNREHFIKEEPYIFGERELYTPKIAPFKLLEKPSFVKKLSPNSFYFNLGIQLDIDYCNPDFVI